MYPSVLLPREAVVIRRPYETQARPQTGPLIKGVGGEVGAAGPYDGPGLRIGFDLGKSFGGAGVFENRAAHAVQDLNLSAQTVGKVSRRTPWRTTSAAVISGVSRSSQRLDI
jgi:hypothetical protein